MKLFEVGDNRDKQFKPVKLIMVIESRAEFANLLGRASLPDNIVARLVSPGITPRFRPVLTSMRLYETLRAIGEQHDFWRESVDTKTSDE